MTRGPGFLDLALAVLTAAVLTAAVFTAPIWAAETTATPEMDPFFQAHRQHCVPQTGEYHAGGYDGRVTVFTSPSDLTKVDTVRNGQRLQVAWTWTGEGLRWGYVTLPGGKGGWVPMDDLAPLPEAGEEGAAAAPPLSPSQQRGAPAIREVRYDQGPQAQLMMWTVVAVAGVVALVLWRWPRPAPGQRSVNGAEEGRT